jgi:hypothetical protein
MTMPSVSAEPMYYTPINVWADIYQPEEKRAIKNPPYKQNEL